MFWLDFLRLDKAHFFVLEFVDYILVLLYARQNIGMMGWGFRFNHKSLAKYIFSKKEGLRPLDPLPGYASVLEPWLDLPLQRVAFKNNLEITKRTDIWVFFQEGKQQPQIPSPGPILPWLLACWPYQYHFHYTVPKNSSQFITVKKWSQHQNLMKIFLHLSNRDRKVLQPTNLS